MAYKKYATEEERIKAIKISKDRYKFNNIQKVKESKRKYSKDNADKEKKRLREWYLNNKDNHRISAKIWRDKNRVKNRDIVRSWKKKNIEKVKLLNQKYRQTERGKLSGKSSVHKRLNKKANLNEKTLRHEQIYFVFNKFNNQCFNCKCKSKLELDHHYPLSKGFALTINNTVLLCKSCNSSKGAKLPESFYSPEQLTDLQLNYGISKSPIEEKQLSLFEARMPKNLERDNGILEAMNAA